MQTKRRIPLLAALVLTFGLMGGAVAQGAEEDPGGGGGGGGGMPLDPVICALTGGGGCSDQPSEPGQPSEPSEPQPKPQ